MKNTLVDLNGYLFETLERLNLDEISDQELEKEINRAETIVKVADKIISNASVVLRAEEFKAEYTGQVGKIVNTMLGDGSDRKN